MAVEKLPELTAKDQVVALVAEDCIDTAIATLNDKYKGLKADTKENYELVKKGHTEFVSRRTSIEKRRLSLKRDVDAEAARITKLLAPVELELKTEKDKYEEAEKARKAAIAAEKALAEKARIDKIKSKIAGFSNLAQGLMSKKASVLEEDLNFFKACIKDDDFNYEEFLGESEKIKFETENAIAKAYKERKELEDREAEIAKQQAAIAAQQAVIDEANRIVAEKAAADKLEQARLEDIRREKEQEELRSAQPAPLPEGTILIDDPIKDGLTFEDMPKIEAAACNKAAYISPALPDNSYVNLPFAALPLRNPKNICGTSASSIPLLPQDSAHKAFVLPVIPAKISLDNDEERLIVSQNLRAHSETQFLRHLGIALEDATYDQADRIKNAFPEYWNQYLNWGK